MMESTTHLESSHINSDTANMLYLQLPYLQNGIITTTLTVLFLSLIIAMPRTKKYAFIATVQSWHTTLKSDIAGCLYNIHPPFIFTKKTTILLDTAKHTDKSLTLLDSLASRSSYMTTLVKEKQAQDFRESFYFSLSFCLEFRPKASRCSSHPMIVRDK